MAKSREKYVSQSTGYSISASEKSQIVGQIRRKLSVAFTRVINQCTLNRLTNIGAGSKAMAKRREWALGEEFTMKQERRAYWSAYVNGGRPSFGNIHHFPG